MNIFSKLKINTTTENTPTENTIHSLTHEIRDNFINKEENKIIQLERKITQLDEKIDKILEYISLFNTT